MADSGIHDPKKVVAAIKAAKGRATNFAFVWGKTDVLNVDKAMSGVKMLSILKKDTGNGSGVFGTIEMWPDKAVFHTAKAPSGLDKKIEKVLKTYGASLKVEVVAGPERPDEQEDENEETPTR